MSVALLVIDVQQSFLVRPYWNDAAIQPFRDATLQLIHGCQQAGTPVLYIRHIEEDGPFSLASGLVEPLDWLPSKPDAIFFKRVHNAILESGLQGWLEERGIKHLIISGIRTEQCCETTARVASDLGYSVDFVTDATLTFAMTDRHGRHFSTDEIKARTELVLDERFARIATVDEALRRIQPVPA